jgi:hypothetical protein
MKIRTKILLAMIAVSVIPLIIALWIVGNMAADDLEQQNLLRMKRAKIFVEQTVTYTSTELLNSIVALAHHPDLLAALNPPAAPVRGVQAPPTLDSAAAGLGKLPFDQLQLLDRSGQRLLRRFYHGKSEIPATSGPEHPVILRPVWKGRSMPRLVISTANSPLWQPSRYAPRVATWLATWWR